MTDQEAAEQRRRVEAQIEAAGEQIKRAGETLSRSKQLLTQLEDAKLHRSSGGNDKGGIPEPR